MKTLCIDARFWGVRHTGIGRYVENLIDHLPQDQEIRVVLVVSPESVAEDKLQKYPKYIASYHPYRFLSLLEMHYLLFFKIRPDLLHVPHIVVPFLWPGKIILTVHDLIKHFSRGPQASTHSPMVYWLKYFQYLLMSTVSVLRADSIIVPTLYWKNELVKRYKLNPDKVNVTYEGVTESFQKKQGRKLNIEMKYPYVVYTGNLYPHKNVRTLIEGLEIYNQKAKHQLNLAVACSRSVFEDRLPKSDYTKFLGYLTDAQLSGLYQHAVAFVFPSLIEGFGLTGLEAMAVGCPVIAAWSSCLPEVYGGAALYFDPLNPTNLAEKFSQILADHQLRRCLISEGKKQVKKYSWFKMANQTWEIYQNLLP